LKQTGMSLEDGTKLLDKWVRTSKSVGVSVQDLAQSFAITSDVADTVGVSIDQLNGLIGVLASKTILSSTEIGNALRTMFANITSDEAVKTLKELGIAVTDVNGNMRDWLDINQNIVDLMNSGALSDEQANKLANALGGGSRRGPQLLTLWKNFSDVGRVASESMNANGEAADAMGKKLETLQGALNLLHNAFNQLVEALGYNGGFLDLVVDGIKVTTEFVKSLTSLAESFDKGAASITAAMIAYLALKRVIGTVNWETLGGGTMPVPGGPFGQRQAAPGPFGQFANYFGRTPDTSTLAGAGQAGVQGLTQAAPVIIGEIARGLANHESINTIGPRVGASLASAFVGNMIIPGAGGLIGSFIADAIVNQIQEKQSQIREVLTGGTKGLNATDTQAKINQLTKANLWGTGANLPSNLANKFSDEQIAKLVQDALTKGILKNGGRDNTHGGSAAAANYFEQAGYTEDQAKLLANVHLTISQQEALNILYQQLGNAIELETSAH
jgi:TP901 family phage tail tape measure protein